MSNTSTVQVTSATTLTTTTETVAATSTTNIENQPGGQGVCINGVVNVTAGTGTTAVTIRVRAGSGITGTVIGNAVVHTLAAAAVANIPFETLDNSAGALVGTVTYSVTVQQTGASGNGTVNQATIMLEPSNAAP